MADETPESPSTARLRYDTAVWRLSEQNRAIESIERKIASAIAAWGVLIVLFVGILAFGEGGGSGSGASVASSVEEADINGSGGGLVSGVGETEWLGVLVVAVLFISSASCAVKGYRVQGWRSGPKLSDMRAHAETYADDAILRWTANALAEAQRHNQKAIARKARWCNASLYLLLLALGTMVAFVLALSFPY